jgi:hypothetical protein
MLSIAELAHQRDPKAIAEIICQELQPLDIDQLNIAVDIVDSSLELQIRTDSAIDKEKLLTLVHSKLQNLHIESVAKFRIHCWRNDEEMHEQRLLWTEQFMLEMPQSFPRSFPDIEADLDRKQLSETRAPETRAAEPQLSKQSVLKQAIEKITPANPQANNHLLASNLAPYPATENETNTNTALVPIPKGQNSQSSSNYGQLVLVGLSIVLIGLGIGASVRAITSKTAESSSSSAVTGASVDNKAAKNATLTTKITPSQISEATASPSASKSSSSAVELIPPSPNLQEQEQVVTLEKFNRIQKGMTIDQVEKVFGASGKVIAENKASNSIGQVYSWKNPQGSNAIIEFKDGQVVAKAQAGL